jgi:hypothetical protein
MNEAIETTRPWYIGDTVRINDDMYEFGTGSLWYIINVIQYECVVKRQHLHYNCVELQHVDTKKKIAMSDTDIVLVQDTDMDVYSDD